MHQVPSSFVTLTYDETGPSLHYPDFQRFMYRLRRALGPTRFFMCGEYGEQGLRPHFHAILFGRQFPDGVPCGKDLFRSRRLDGLWSHGFASVGGVTYQSAAYVARYATKKITGALARDHYRRVDLGTGECVDVVPEFAHMSLKPGIGYTWWNRYWREVVTHDGVVRPGGQKVPSPRYYDELTRRMAELLPASPFSDALQDQEFARWANSQKFLADTTPDRLAVREKCALAKAKFLRRTL